MEASKVYYTDFRCPVGTSLLEKLRRVCIAENGAAPFSVYTARPGVLY